MLSSLYGDQCRKTKLMTNSTNGISTDIRDNGEKLETVESFKYLGAIVTYKGSKPKFCPGLHRQRHL